MRSIIGVFIVMVFLSSCAREVKTRNDLVKPFSESTVKVNKDNSDEIKAGNLIEGKVIKVHDGDTYDLLLKNSEIVKVRMEGIDAPEGGMPYFKVTKNYLTDKIGGRNVRVQIKDIDQYKRLLGLTYLKDKEWSAEMLKSGMAWHFKKYNTDIHFAELEKDAKEKRLGLWQEDNPVPPWIHRKLRPRRISTKDLRVYSKKTLELTEVSENIKYKDIEIEIVYSGEDVLLKISKENNSIQDINFQRSSRPQEINIADYNMDGEFDIMVLKDNKPQYFLYSPIDKEFVLQKDWNFMIWKLNKPKKQILTTSNETSYEGQVFLFQVENRFEVKLLEIVNFDLNN